MGTLSKLLSPCLMLLRKSKRILRNQKTAKLLFTLLDVVSKANGAWEVIKKLITLFTG